MRKFYELLQLIHSRFSEDADGNHTQLAHTIIASLSRADVEHGGRLKGSFVAAAAHSGEARDRVVSQMTASQVAMAGGSAGGTEGVGTVDFSRTLVGLSAIGVSADPLQYTNTLTKRVKPAQEGYRRAKSQRMSMCVRLYVFIIAYRDVHVLVL